MGGTRRPEAVPRLGRSDALRRRHAPVLVCTWTGKQDVKVSRWHVLGVQPKTVKTFEENRRARREPIAEIYDWEIGGANEEADTFFRSKTPVQSQFCGLSENVSLCALCRLLAKI